MIKLTGFHHEVSLESRKWAVGCSKSSSIAVTQARCTTEDHFDHL